MYKRDYQQHVGSDVQIRIHGQQGMRYVYIYNPFISYLYIKIHFYTRPETALRKSTLPGPISSGGRPDFGPRTITFQYPSSYLHFLSTFWTTFNLKMVPKMVPFFLRNNKHLVHFWILFFEVWELLICRLGRFLELLELFMGGSCTRKTFKQIAF